MIVYVTENKDKYFRLIGEHIAVSLIALLTAILIGFVLSYIGYRYKKIGKVMYSIISFFRIIPSLAVLIICIPYIGVGVTPAVIALIFLAIPPIYINTLLAFEEIPEHYKEVGRGMGFTRRQIFYKVEIPLALSKILLGIRIAAIEVIASATIASYIGAGGIGSMILTGLNLYRMDLLLLGGITVAILALLTDGMLYFMERCATYYKQK